MVDSSALLKLPAFGGIERPSYPHPPTPPLPVFIRLTLALSLLLISHCLELRLVTPLALRRQLAASTAGRDIPETMSK
ncbi:unnamed protein product [Pleuronectes platessa]|uniref:Uncharacterized protein n=1 Tax=Pleuronectes platessa TaxID=8262 RepID=A0A9N7VKC5_PLEPL|nr:unnamed protein product [Pleuronectes platessa]